MGQGARVPAGRRPAGRAQRSRLARRSRSTTRHCGQRNSWPAASAIPRRSSGSTRPRRGCTSSPVTSMRSAAEGERILPLARLTGNRIKEAEALATIAWAIDLGPQPRCGHPLFTGGARRRRTGRRARRAGQSALHDRVRSRRDRRARRESCGARQGDRDQQRRGRCGALDRFRCRPPGCCETGPATTPRRRVSRAEGLELARERACSSRCCSAASCAG